MKVSGPMDSPGHSQAIESPLAPLEFCLCPFSPIANENQRLGGESMKERGLFRSRF